MEKTLPAEAPLSSLISRLVAGEPRALAQALSLIEEGGELAQELYRQIWPRLGRAVVVGFTGSPGAGKSTLISAYIGALRKSGRSVAVAAVDPSSPVSGGALLGDRIRMGRHGEDAGVFVRSVASRGHLGGLSGNTHRIVDAMDASGRDVIVIETVGAGQSEVEIVELADVRIVVVAPGFGDEVQAMKAGILEIADILVVNKSDLQGARQTAAQLGAMLQLRHGRGSKTPVLQTVATSGEGADKLCNAIDEISKHCDRPKSRERRIHLLIAQSAARIAQERIIAGAIAEVDSLVAACARGEIGIEAAALKLLARLVEPPPDD
jgi:LAO/AO transport system kinase